MEKKNQVVKVFFDKKKKKFTFFRLRMSIFLSCSFYFVRNSGFCKLAPYVCHYIDYPRAFPQYNYKKKKNSFSVDPPRGCHRE
jgi:hypothetical protein